MIPLGISALRDLLPQSETAAANSFNTLMRSIGTTVSAAVVGVVLSQMTIQLGEHTLPSEAGFRTGMLAGCSAALVAAAITLALPIRKAGPSTDQDVLAGADSPATSPNAPGAHAQEHAVPGRHAR